MLLWHSIKPCQLYFVFVLCYEKVMIHAIINDEARYLRLLELTFTSNYKRISNANRSGLLLLLLAIYGYPMHKNTITTSITYTKQRYKKFSSRFPSSKGKNVVF